MINPSAESFLASKSMVLICIGLAAVVVLVVLAVAVKVIWGIDVFQLVVAGIGGITAHTTGGVVRNTMVDGPTRAANAAAATGITPGQMQQPAVPPTAPPSSYGPPPPTNPQS